MATDREETLLYTMALSNAEGIGVISTRKLIDFFGDAKAVFTEGKKLKEKVDGVQLDVLKKLDDQLLRDAEKELKFIEENNVDCIYYKDQTYPYRLNQCPDAPVLIYYRGTKPLTAERVISVVGTRKATKYGLKLCNDLVEALKNKGVLVVSGLAYGIDKKAHESALTFGLDTIGVLGHGLDRIYPAAHRSLAVEMMENGGLLSEFKSGTIPDRENFPKRNRIIAGMADATVVVESKETGGSMITANIANSYSREVFAFPGRVTDPCSAGCNDLIFTNRAALINSPQDLIKMMGWQDETDKKKRLDKSQKDLSLLSSEEMQVLSYLQEHQQSNLDDIGRELDIPVHQLSVITLNLELQGIIRSHPGKVYEAV